ncbi:Crp/Fnr family transcriptional regulator [Xaviernesmea oryzae]|uniref:Crp/Fnr family transcriptional regulator n=1 Tax=Xaviernesmea oryzae TaxID=464029 RepID=A0A1Q9ASK5_9HYPH|nr:Crp/Fnr family transcriptional regulator [Xaviernesmea oryzae]OLP58400.1 Crp/Fnr family transcriptional regulator [Xaviernesmea oryzae]
MSETSKSPAFWRSFPIFEDFDGETIARLASLAHYRKWPAGTVLFQRGDEGQELIAVLSGRIKLSLITPQGRELVLRSIEPGALFGEMSVLDGQPRSADAVTVAPTEAYVIGKAAFLDLVTHRPAAAEAIIRHICGMLRETNDRLETLALYELNARVARFFLTLLRQLHGTDLPPEAHLRLSLSQSDIAGILGASRPKVNRAILALEEAGAIRRGADGVIACLLHPLMRLAEPDEA